MENKVKIWFDEHNIYYKDEFGNTESHPLQWFPRLLNATPKERLDFEFSPFGIHWPRLDEDLSFEGFKQQDKLVTK